MAHSNHNHSHTHTNNNKKILVISLIIISIFMIIEFVGGVITNSLALLADAGHMLSDSFSLMIALFAVIFSSKKANSNKTFGYKRLEILGAIINGILLIIIALYIIYEAIERFGKPTEIASQGMLIIAFIGLIVNVVVAWIMRQGSDVKKNINMRGAYLHVISDMLGSVGAIIAGLLILFFGYSWADSLASLIVAILILRSGYLISKSSLHILMEGAPENISIENILKEIKKIEGVIEVHDLHLWSITSDLNMLICHVVIDKQITYLRNEQIIKEIKKKMLSQNIHHVTIQLENHKCTRDNSLFCQLES